MNALTTQNNVSTMRRDLTPAQLELARRTVAKDCNTDEFDLFMAVAQRSMLDPFRKQISVVIFNKKARDQSKRQMAIITTIDGFRVIANRQGNYRPMETPPVYEIDEALKGPDNPHGIVSATVQCWKAQGGAWHPVVGIAYWAEFAPTRETCPDGYEKVDTGETWPSGDVKYDKVPKGPLVYTLEPGNWMKMPRHMIAKCAEAQALRRGWPDDMSGLYIHEEMERAIIIDSVASEVVEDFAEARRVERVGGGDRAYFVFESNGKNESIERGQIADRIVAWVEKASVEDVKGFKLRNADSLRQFWAWEPSDALAIKKMMEDKIASTPVAAPGAASPAVDSSPLPAGQTDAEQNAPAAAVVQKAPQLNLGGGGTLFDEGAFNKAWTAFEARVDNAASRTALAELQDKIVKSPEWANATEAEQEEMKQRIMRKLKSF